MMAFGIKVLVMESPFVAYRPAWLWGVTHFSDQELHFPQL